MLGAYDAVYAQSCHVCFFLKMDKHLRIQAPCHLPLLEFEEANPSLRNYTPPQRPALTDPNNSWLKKKILGVLYAVIGVLSRPAYAIPLLLNVTGSVWFFILIGKAELSLTVPITNSLAFMFTVLGEWWAEKKVISRGKLYNECDVVHKPDDGQIHGLVWHSFLVASAYVCRARLHRRQKLH